MLELKSSLIPARGFWGSNSSYLAWVVKPFSSRAISPALTVAPDRFLQCYALMRPSISAWFLLQTLENGDIQRLWVGITHIYMNKLWFSHVMITSHQKQGTKMRTSGLWQTRCSESLISGAFTNDAALDSHSYSQVRFQQSWK